MGQTFITASQIDNVEHVFDTVALMVASTDLAVGDRVRTLGYTTIGDGGGNDYQIVAAATGTADGGEYIDLATHQAKGLFHGGIYNAKQWGVVADGTTNDTTDIQSFFSYISTNSLEGILPYGKTINVTNNLYIWGGASLKGKATIKLSADPTYNYFIICGAASYGAAAQDCTGRFEGFKIDIQSPSIQEIGLFIGSANKLKVTDVEVATNGKCSNKGIGSIPNNSFVTGASRDSITVNRCLVTGASSGDGEPFGFASCNNLRFQNNSVIDGKAYDDIGFHACSRVSISNNYMKSWDGRLYVSDSKAVKIHNNTIHYESTSQGMGIYIGSESTANPDFCDDIDIAGNTVWYGSSITGFGYGIRIESGRNVRIRGNYLKNDSAQDAGSIYIEKQNLAGWVDPSSVDSNDAPDSHTVLISNNICEGKIRCQGGDGIKILSNEADKFEVESPSVITEFAGNVSTSGTVTDNQFDATNKEATTKLFSRCITNAGAAYVKGKEYNGAGGTTFYCQRAVAVSHFKVSSTTTISAGFYQIELLLNGVKTGATKTYNGTSTQVSFIASAGTKDYIADVGDTLEVQVKTNNGTPTPNDVVVEVYGFELT
jgi:hypothetical protein